MSSTIGQCRIWNIGTDSCSKLRTSRILLYSQLPRLIPQFLSLALSRFEIAVRSATVLGIVGAGGIRAPIIFAVASRNWERVAIILIGVVVAVSVIDWISGMLRKLLR